MSHARQAAPNIGQHIDYAAAVLLHALHIALTRKQESAVQVVAHHRVPAFEADVTQVGGVLPTCAVEQSMDLPMNGQDVPHGLPDSLLVADVTAVHADTVLGFRVTGSNFLSHRFELVTLAAHQRQVCTQTGQFMRCATPQAAATARDDMGLSRKQIGPKHRAVAFRGAS